jgi:hypothetical protein
VPGWVTTDPDSLYHARRLLRFWSEDGPVAERDAYLDFPRRLPEGAPIPWPPYYTYVLALARGPVAPDGGAGPESADGERLRRFVEQGAASLPLVFGVRPRRVSGQCHREPPVHAASDRRSVHP